MKSKKLRILSHVFYNQISYLLSIILQIWSRLKSVKHFRHAGVLERPRAVNYFQDNCTLLGAQNQLFNARTRFSRPWEIFPRSNLDFIVRDLTLTCLNDFLTK